MLRIEMLESFGWVMDTSITRLSGDMFMRVDGKWGEMRMAVCLEMYMSPCHIDCHRV